MDLKVVGMGVIALMINACSSPPRRHTPAAPEPTASAAAVTNTVAAPAANGTTPAVDRALIKAGYQPAMFNGKIYYCRMEASTGSQITSKVCLNEAQVQELQRKGQEMRDWMSQPKALPRACTPPMQGC